MMKEYQSCMLAFHGLSVGYIFSNNPKTVNHLDSISKPLRHNCLSKIFQVSELLESLFLHTNTDK